MSGASWGAAAIRAYLIQFTYYIIHKTQAVCSVLLLQDEEVSSEDLAAVDPLAGFLATEPLPRLRFLLQHR
jgi:hypothetical protein